MKKSLLFSGLLILLLVSSCSLTLVKAQNNPQIPTFTLNLADHSFDVLPTYAINSYTGENETVQPGYHVEKKLIEVNIENQYSYSQYATINSSQVKVYYDIRYKGHFDNNWLESSSISNLVPSDGNYTTIDFGYGNNNPGGFLIWAGYIPPNGQVDFQVQAFLGYYKTTTVQTGNPGCWRNETTSVFEKTGLSGWSVTQTIMVDPIPVETPNNTAGSDGNVPPFSPAPTAGTINNTVPTPAQNGTPIQTGIPFAAENASTPSVNLPTDTVTSYAPLILGVTVGLETAIIVALIALLRVSRKTQKKT